MTDHDHPPGPTDGVSLAAAQAAAGTVLDAAKARGVGVVVVVAAISGDPIALARMDGVPPLAAESALRKCRTVALTWRSTASFAKSLRDDLASEPEFFHGMHHIGPLMTIGGGVPVVRNGVLVAIVAVSGASTDDDVALAETGAAALGHATR
jgi:glc operon protein GlcG